MKEATFKNRIRDRAKELKWRCKKVASAMGHISLDLYVRTVMHGAMWWELKTIPTKGTEVGLTQRQRHEAKREIQAGGSAACVVCCKIENTDYIYVIGTEDTHVRDDQLVQARGIGDPIDLNAIANAVIAQSERERIRQGE